MISLIVPVRDEEEIIGDFLDHLPAGPDLEVIVVDGGSRDQTRAKAREHPVRLLQSPPGRGIQLNRGAAAARGDIFLFVHCDTRLPRDFQEQIIQVLQRPGIVAGAFRLEIDADGTVFRIIEIGANLRSRYLCLPYGDQGIFLQRTFFQAVNGFPDQPLMEDLALVRRLRRLGRIGLAGTRVRTSARRWHRQGVIRTTLLNQLLLAAYALGVAPTTLARLYYGRDKRTNDRRL